MTKSLARGRRQRLMIWALGTLIVTGVVFALLRAQGLNADGLNFSVSGRDYHLSDSRALWLLVSVPLLLFGLGHSFADLPWQQRVLSFLLRGAFFCTLVFGLGRPVEREESSRVCATVLVDVSTSVGDASLATFRQRIVDIDAKKGKQDEVRVLVFAARAAEVQLVRGAEGKLQVPTIQELRAAVPGSESSVQGALDIALALNRSDCVSRVLLFSDGIETRGSALSTIEALRRRGARVHTALFDEDAPSDVAIVGVELPESVVTGEPFKLRVKMKSTRKARGQLRLYQGSTLNGLGGARVLELKVGDHSETFESVVRVPGDVSYRAEFIPASEDAFEQNNEYTTSVEVPGPPRVLIIDRQPAQMTYLARALVAQQLDVDVRSPKATPQTGSELAQFQFVILSDLSRSDVTRGAEALFTRYVKAGGGLLFAGGEAGYGPGGWQGSQLEKILPVRMDAHKERETPGVAMALVIDRSGSMTGLPLAMAKEACNATLGVLDPKDLIEVIAFDSRPKRAVKLQPARYRARIQGSVSRILPGGGTEIFSSLDMAYQDLAAVEARKKHIILLTDGNAGSDGIYELASAAFSDGITITTVGLGSGANRSLLSMVAESGGGRLHLVEDASRLPRIFTRETELISKKATLEDWFPVSVIRGAEFLKGVGIGAAPLLRGYTSTRLAPAPSQLILASDRGEPILARRPLGLGWTLAWTSDFKARWATDWLKWSQFGRFVAQMVREHQKTDNTELRPMEVEVVGDELVASLEAYDELEDFDSSLESTLRVRLVGAQSEQAAERSQKQESDAISFHLVAPGLYQARASLPEFGSYSVKAVHRRRNTEGELVSAGVSFASVSRPYPEEYRDLEPRPESLKRWAQFGGGTSDPPPELLWGSQGDSVQSTKGRQNHFIFLAILLFLVDLLVRRVRLFDRQFSALTR